jgi:RHS repeat-associated protein
MKKVFKLLLTILIALYFPFSILASNKSGITPNTISLPKGPGSIEGLGESFQPTLNTGTAKYKINLKLPPSRYAPELILKYDGGSANSSTGFGWHLNISYVQRQTDKGIPRYLDTQPDIFIDNSKEELIPQKDGFYFHNNEGAFIRYKQVADHWEGTMPNGNQMIFGQTAQARVTDSDTGHIFRWMLEKQVDTNGNTILYSYTSFEGEENKNQVYISKIEYAAGTPPWNTFHFVFFEYADRKDWFEDCRSGFVVRTGKRITNILIGTQGIELANHVSGDFNKDDSIDYLNRRYELTYDASDHWSLLTSLTLWGADNKSKLPPMTFGYTLNKLSDRLSASSATIGSINTPTHIMDNDLVDLLDINGDGLPDIFKTDLYGGQHTAYLNKGEVKEGNDRAIQWDSVKEFSGDKKAQNINLQNDSNAIAHLADMDGNGLADLVYKTATDEVYYFPNSGNISWGKRCQMSIDSLSTMPPSPFGAQHIKTADMDFDKRIDIIQSISVGNSADYRIWFNLGEQRYSKSVTVSQTAGYMLSDTGVHIADFNGDRVPDILRVRPTGVEVTTGLGYGVFTIKRTIFLPDYTLTDGQIQKAKLQDITGDGLVDLVIERAEANHLWYWVNQGNYTLDIKRVITDMPTVYGQKPAIRWADMNGNGTVDFVYADQYANPRIQIVDIGELIGCVPTPNILNAINNGIGSKIRIQYKTSASFALSDASQGNEWPDPLPSPVNVVSKIIVDDSLGNTYVTDLQYHDGYYDVSEHEFRGFASVDQIETGDPSAPTQVTNFLFDTGRDVEAMKGKMLRQTVTEKGLSAFFWEEITEWSQPIELMSGTNGKPVIFVHQSSRTRKIKEQDRGSPKTIYSEYDYDRYGNQTESREYGIVDGNDKNVFNDERITIVQYAYNLTDWLVRYPKRKELRDGNDTIISLRETYYDDQQFAGNNFGVVISGNPTLIRERMNQDKTIDTHRTRYDTYGNPILLFDPLGNPTDFADGHCREIAYDSNLHTYPITETIHVGKNLSLVIRADYDIGFGTIKSSTDFNENITTYAYDTFARMVSIVHPDDSSESPSTSYGYYLNQQFGETGIINYVETLLLDEAPNSKGYYKKRDFIDGLGRELMTKEDAGASGYAVKEAVWFNARKQKKGTLQPFYSDTFDFEDIRAPGWQGRFHQNGKTVSLDFESAQNTVIYYDASLRPIKTINPDKTWQKIVYEPLITKIYDENDADADSDFYNTPIVHYKDGLGRLNRVDEIIRLNNDGTPSDDLKTWTTQYEYRADDVLTKIIDSMGNIKQMEYDALKRKTSMHDPDRGVMTYQYDDVSNLIETIDAKNQKISYTYDGANRLLTENYHDTSAKTPDVVYYYDKPVEHIDFGSNNSETSKNTKGFLSCVTDLSGNEYNSYDTRGRIKWMVKQIPDPQNKKLISYKTEMNYDAMDRLTEMIYPDGDRCFFSYNARNLLQRIKGGAAHNKGGGQHIISEIVYSPSGQIIQTQYGNGIVTEYAYDSRTRLSTLKAAPLTHLAQPIIAYAYIFDNASNIKTINDLRPEEIKPAGDKLRNTQNFIYDDLYRLNSVQYSYNLSNQNLKNDGNISYRYDPIGNMISKTSDIDHRDKGKSITNIGIMNYAENQTGPHALTSANNGKDQRTFSYDSNGNMTNIDGITCTWDYKDRLIAVENEIMRTTYTYDYTDRRISKKVWRKNNNQLDESPLRTTVYVNKYFEVREGNQPTKYVFNDKTRVARIIGSLDISSKRIQRFQLFKGWNLISFAVDTNDSGKQLGIGIDENIEVAFRWLPDQKKYDLVDEKTPLPKGSILWVRVKNDAVFFIIGDYYEPSETISVSLGRSIIAPAALMSLPSLFENPVKSAWLYSNQKQSWEKEFIHTPIISDIPDFIDVGQPIHFLVTETTVLQLPKLCQRIQYYHQDHLGSSNVITDGNGDTINETVFYPFGHPRNHAIEASSRNVLSSKYMFTGKELDQESGLQYFETRYYAGYLGNFVSVDSLVSSQPIDFIKTPQAFNNYAYALRNPIFFKDETGEWVQCVVGALVSGAMEIAIQAVEHNLSQDPNKGSFKIKWGSVALEAAAGAATSGLSSISKMRHLTKFAKLANVGRAAATKKGKAVVAGLNIAADTAKEYYKQKPDKRSLGKAFAHSASSAIVGKAVKATGVPDMFKGNTNNMSETGTLVKKIANEIHDQLTDKVVPMHVQAARGMAVEKAFE